MLYNAHSASRALGGRKQYVCVYLKVLPQIQQVLIGVKTGVKYNQDQWEAIQHIQDHLEEPKSPRSDSMKAKDQDPNLTIALMRLCMLVVM